MTDRRPGALSHEQVSSVIDALERMGPNTSGSSAQHADPWSRGALGARTRDEGTTTASAPQEAKQSPAERLAAWEAQRAEAHRQRVAAARKEETKECTFRPEIHQMSGGPVRSSEPFPDRLARLAKASEQRRERLVKEAEAVATGECTFAPEIHESPIAAPKSVDDSRLGSGAVDEDGFDEDGVKVFEYVPVEERMTQARLHHLLGSDWRQRDDPECTFRPAISAVAESMHEASRCHDASKSVYVRLYEHSTACYTAASPAKSASPGAARATDGTRDALPAEHERELRDLRDRFGSRPNTADAFAGFLQSVLGTSDPTPFADVLNHASDDGLSSQASADDHAQDQSKGQRYVRFNDFITRQNELELRRRRAIERVRREVEGPFQPPICEHSRVLALQARERGHETSRSKLHPPPDPTPSFKPTVSARSARHPARDSNAMHGDAAAIKERKAQLRAEKDTAEQKALTFRPRVNEPPKAYKKIQSVLSRQNLPQLMNRLATAENQREDSRRSAQQKREEKEVASCTFQPKLNRVPRYVADMARSSHVLRETFETI